MTAGERVARRFRQCGFHSLEGRVELPGTRHAEGDLKSLYQKAGEKIGKAKNIGAFFADAPVHPADHSYYEYFLPEICDLLKEEISGRGT